MTSANTIHHDFTNTILSILQSHFGDDGLEVFEKSALIGYLNIKTQSANRGSKARSSFANLYALYVLVEDYIKNGYFDGSAPTTYARYEGAKFSTLFSRQRELPFGAKLQNHALNSRLNDEFRKYYAAAGLQPIVRDVETQRYWLQEDLLQVKIRTRSGSDAVLNIAHVIIDVVEEYIHAKQAAFEQFLTTCQEMVRLDQNSLQTAIIFVKDLLKPSVDARIFEIVSYAVLKAQYAQQMIWIGNSKEFVAEHVLTLYKTGRTNANDGGIDFVMRPLGRFFQVTETLAVNKYFLDIDKVQKFPMTFVVKTDKPIDEVLRLIKRQAESQYHIEAIVNSYMAAIEEIINVPILLEYLEGIIARGGIHQVMDEIISQSKVEFNFSIARSRLDLL